LRLSRNCEMCRRTPREVTASQTSDSGDTTQSSMPTLKSNITRFMGCSGSGSWGGGGGSGFWNSSAPGPSYWDQSR
jgi:hypothetical protein